MPPAITTVALIVGDIAETETEAIRLLRELRYFAERESDVAGDRDPIIVVIDGPAWQRVLPAELLTAHGLTVITLDAARHLPATLINHVIADISTEWVSFCWPGTEVSTWYANKAALLKAGRASQANIVAGYRGPGESRLASTNSVESFLVHPDDGFSSDYPHAWLQMLDLVPMANAIVRNAFIREIGGFTTNPQLQRHFWWAFTLRAANAGKIDSVPLQPIPVKSWHRYAFAAELGAPDDSAIRLMMASKDAQGAQDVMRSKRAQGARDVLPDIFSKALQAQLHQAREKNQKTGLRITVLGGVNEPAHNQLCFFNFFELIQNLSVLTWRSVLDEIAHPADLALCDLVIFSRVKSARGVTLMNFCREQNIPTLYMLDDNWFWLGREWPEYASVFSPGSAPFENFLHCLKNADTVLTYNRHLADDLEPYAKRLAILPTNVDLARFERRPRPSPDAAITLGYVGSVRKNSQPFQALVEIARARPEVKIFVMSNNLPDELTALPPGRVMFQPYQFNYAAYAATVCDAAPDVLIAPVGRTRFEASKCPNKYLEITACGAVGVYSNAEPYISIAGAGPLTGYVRENENGLLADDDVAIWRSQIERLIDDAPLRHRLAERALKNVESSFDTPAVLPQFLAMLLAAVYVGDTDSALNRKRRAWMASSKPESEQHMPALWATVIGANTVVNTTHTNRFENGLKKAVARITQREDFWAAAQHAFPAFAHASSMAALHQSGYLLQFSGNLASVDSHTYAIRFDTPQTIKRLTLVPVITEPESNGVLILEWLSPAGNADEQNIINRKEIALNRLGPLPLISMACAANAAVLAGQLRLSVRGARSPVRVLEWRRYRHGGLTLELQPFVLFQFA